MSARTGADRDQLHVHPGVAAATSGLALLALAASWQWVAIGSGNSERVAAIVVSLCLMVATVAAYLFPLQLGRHTKVYLSSVAYYLLAVLVAPPLAATAAGMGSLLGELSVQKRRGTQATDVVTQVGRRVLVVLAGSMVAHLSEGGVMHILLLVAAALVLGIGDVVTFPLIVGRLTGEPPLRIIVTAVRQAYLVEGEQYLLGLLGGLAGARQFWALALLVPPTVLVYLAFRANARAQDARYAAQEAAEALRELEEERAQHARELAARVLQAQEEERKRIARELHDETAQALSVLLANLDLLEQYPPENHAELRAGLERVRTLARRVLDETRALSHDLRPTILDDVGLLAALEWLAAEYERTYGGAASFRAAPNLGEALSAEQEVALFRIAQEALTNSGKHAAARTVDVALSFPDSSVRLVVEDDGRGFDVDHVPGPTREGRLGLYGMRERATLLGGRLQIATIPGRGTRVVAELPLTEARDVEAASPSAYRSKVGAALG